VFLFMMDEGGGGQGLEGFCCDGVGTGMGEVR
jgi:hypothetical protein